MNAVRTICLGFLGVILVGALLLLLPFSLADFTWGDPVTALFTATSAVCVTGLSVVDVGTYYSFWGQLEVALLAQVGGLGYMTATTFLLLILGHRFGLKDKLAIQQSLDRPGLGGTIQIIRSIIATTAIIEILGVVLLWIGLAPDLGALPGLWSAIFHSINAFNNAGFSLFPNNLMNYVQSPLIVGVITAQIILGGIGYPVIMETYLWIRDRVQRRLTQITFSLNTKIVVTTTLVLLFLGTTAFLVIESGNPKTLGTLPFSAKLLAAWFQSVTPRTAGFNTIDNGLLTTTGLFVTIALMFIGASPSGTGGGIKTTTVRVLISATQAALQGKTDVISYERQIPIILVLKAVGVALGSLVAVIGSTALLSLTEPSFSFLQILFESMSAFATVGLSTGITAKLSVLGRLIIIVTMYVGRVGILTLIGALQKEPEPSRIHYPEETFLVG